MICTYNPTIKARVTAVWNRINPFKKKGGEKPKKKKTGKEAA
jgi:hypothetical protein